MVCQKTKNSLLLLLAVVCPYFLKAQDSVAKITKPGFVHASLYYDFPKSYGASAGIDFPLRSKVKIHISDVGKTTIRHSDLILNADIGFYRKRFSNTGIFLIPSIGKRYYKDGPFYFELLIGAGIERTFYDGVVYAVDENGKVIILSDYGRFYATVNIATTFGWNFDKGHYPKPFAIQVKPVLWFQFPYNSFMLPHLSIEAGIKYHFSNFNVRVKPKVIVK